MTTTPEPAGGSTETGSGTLRDVLRYFLYLGTFGFGGPIASTAPTSVRARRPSTNAAPAIAPRSRPGSCSAV